MSELAQTSEKGSGSSEQSRPVGNLAADIVKPSPATSRVEVSGEDGTSPATPESASAVSVAIASDRSDQDAASPVPTTKSIAATDRQNNLVSRIEAGEVMIEPSIETEETGRRRLAWGSDQDELTFASLHIDQRRHLFAAQQSKIQSRVRWIQRDGRFARHLEFDNDGTPSFVSKDGSRKPIEGLSRAPEVLLAVAAERSRRQAIDEQFAIAEGRAALDPSKSFAERQLAMNSSLPSDCGDWCREVSDFIELLRIGALNDELEKAAEAIDLDPDARAAIVGMGGMALSMFKHHEPNVMHQWQRSKVNSRGD